MKVYKYRGIERDILERDLKTFMSPQSLLQGTLRNLVTTSGASSDLPHKHHEHLKYKTMQSYADTLPGWNLNSK
jgi:hypothetical protein